MKLFNPSIHRYGEIVVRAMKDLMLQKAIKAPQAEMITKTMKEALTSVEKPMKAFELALSDGEIERLVKEQEKKK